MVDHYDLVIDGFVSETPYEDPDEILKEVVLNGYDESPNAAGVVVWINLPPNLIGIHLNFDQFKECLRDGRLPKAHKVSH